MKKLSIIFAALVAAMTLKANVVDTLTAKSCGISAASAASYTSFKASGASGAEYEVFAYGKQQYIQIRISDSKSGIASTKSGGYVKSVTVVMNAGQTKSAVDVEIYASNDAYTAAADMYKNEAIKVGVIHTQTTGKYTFDKNYTYVGIKSLTGSRYLDAVYVEWGTDKIEGGDPVVWKPDTIGVSQAKALIAASDINTHYVKGIVATEAFEPISGTFAFYMTDIENVNDSLEAFTVQKADGSKYASLAELQSVVGRGDTVMIFASGLSLYNNKVYETTTCKLTTILGKANVTDVSSLYPYGFGALYQGEEGGKHKWNIAIQTSETDNKGVVLAIANNDNHGIAGNYTLAGTSTYNENGTPVAISGSVKIQYASASASGYNMYNVVSSFMADGKLYRLEGTYELPGWKADLSDNISLENDVPFTPTPGAEITCAQAKEFALSLESGATSDFEVTVIGYVTSIMDAQSNSTQQSFWMDDEKGTKKTFEAFYCDLPVGKKAAAGTKVAVTGKVSNFNGTTAEMKNGKIRIIEGGVDVKRTAVIEEIPDGAISVAQAMEIGNALTAEVGKTVETEQEYIVVGYVAKVSFAMKNDTATWFMTDEEGATFGDLQAYRCKIVADIYAGDQVFVIGKISKYQKDASTANIEIAKGEGHFAALTTDIEEVISTIVSLTDKAVKVIVDGQLFIIRDGKTYTSQGALVK